MEYARKLTKNVVSVVLHDLLQFLSQFQARLLGTVIYSLRWRCLRVKLARLAAAALNMYLCGCLIWGLDSKNASLLNIYTKYFIYIFIEKSMGYATSISLYVCSYIYIYIFYIIHVNKFCDLIIPCLYAFKNDYVIMT